MSKILAVFGATGQQGGSIINYVLNDPELSPKFKIRAITRDVNSEKAKQLKEKVEIVQGDILSRASLETALSGVHTVFAMTTPSFGPDAVEAEYNSAKTIADVAVEKGAEYIIFSTLPAASEISGGKYTKLTPFDAKAKAEQYIRGLPIKSAFYAGASFMENFQSQPFLAPRPAPDGTWVLSRSNAPKGRVPLVDAVGDTGKFVGAILAEPEKYEGKTFCGAVGLYSFEEIAAVMSKATGKTVVYKQLPVEEFRQGLLTMLPPPVADVFVDGFGYGEDFGYFGPDEEKLVAWAVENARGKLTTLEEFFEAHPLQLE
ncbi:NAD(P)-binding protein [Stipitochalara longipes BDJ]|nr:NAD(P)-binding protein [Stipitochalara longipes BDJ]